MRKFITLLALCAVIFTSCASEKSIPSQLDAFVDKTEQKAPTYQKQDWEASQAEYESLITLLSENFDTLSKEEKQQALEAVGRYHAILIKNGLQESMKVINAVKEWAPSYLNGLFGIVKDNQENISSSLKKILDVSELEKTVTSIGEGLSGLLKTIADSLETK